MKTLFILIFCIILYNNIIVAQYGGQGDIALEDDLSYRKNCLARIQAIEDNEENDEDDGKHEYDLNNMSLIKVDNLLSIPPWNPNFYSHIEYSTKYLLDDLIDKTLWWELLNFKTESYDVTNSTPGDYIQGYELTCANIQSVNIVLWNKGFMSYGKEYDNYYDCIKAEQMDIIIIEPKILRLFELFLRNLEVTVPLIPELPPGNLGNINFRGLHQFGILTVNTTKGSFNIILQGNSFLLSSEQTKVKYPFHNKGIALLLDYILSENGGKFPDDLLAWWSGEGDIKVQERFFQRAFDRLIKAGDACSPVVLTPENTESNGQTEQN